MTAKMDKSEIISGCVYYVLSYFLLPYLLSIGAGILHIPQWMCQVFLFILNFICTIFIFRRFLLQSLRHAAQAKWEILRHTFIGLVFYFTANLVTTYCISLVRPDFTNLNDAAIISLSQKGSIWIAISAVLFVPLAEEMLFRGLLFDAQKRKSPMGAWFLSVGAFSAIHIIGYIGSYDLFSFILAFIQYLPAGLALSYAYHFSGSIFAPIIMHTIINLIGVIILL